MELPAWYRRRPFAARHFRRIVEVARTGNPFFRRWLEGAEAVPVMPRDTYQAHNDEILNGLPPTARTSGSSGRPLRVHHDADRRAIERRELEDFVRTLGGPLRAIRLINPVRKPPSESVFDISNPIDAQLAYIADAHQRLPVEAITTYPTNAVFLSRAVLEQGLDMSHIRRFGVFAEAFDPFQEEIVRKAFPNARIWSSYSSEEFGLIATPCPHEPGFHHFHGWKLGVEVLNDDDEPCREGERGRVVVTDYFNTAAPFIRYELGDLAVVATCPCGRIQTPATTRIAGKILHHLVRRDGHRIGFSDIGNAFLETPGIRRFQVIQDGVEDYIVNLVCDRQVDDLKRIREGFRKDLGYVPRNMEVRFVDDIPLGATGKFHKVICRI